MNKIDSALINDAKEFVTHMLTHELSGKYLFHSLNHTLDVLKNVEIIGKFSSLNGEKINLLRISALFHDVGYIDSYDNHEVFSAKRACNYLRSKNVSELSIKQVERAILSTRTPQNPQDQISRILCDADLMNLTYEDYFDQIELMRLEWEQIGNINLNSHQFNLNSLEFFQKHKYHSEYGKKVLQPKKEKNEQRIRSRVFIED